MQWQTPLIFLIDQLVFRPGVWILSRRPKLDEGKWHEVRE